MTARASVRHVSLAVAALTALSACATASRSTTLTDPVPTSAPAGPAVTTEPSSTAGETAPAASTGEANTPTSEPASPPDAPAETAPSDSSTPAVRADTDDDGEEVLDVDTSTPLPGPQRTDGDDFEPVLVAPARAGFELPPTPPSTPGFDPVRLVEPDDSDGGGDDGFAIGDITFTAATGCADHCIDDAQISTAGGSSSFYDLRVDLRNAADVEAYLSLSPIERNADGSYVRPFSTPTATGSVGANWTTSFNLEPATEYHLLVRAIDDQGASQVVGAFTTAAAAGPDQLATPSACAEGCIDDITFDADTDGNGFHLELTTTEDATIDFQWSTEQFEFDADGRPTLDSANTASADAGVNDTTTLDVGGLTPNTAYSIIVTATDNVGGVDRWTARVATQSPTIFASIHFLHIDGDGDHGSNNRGEITFRYGAGDVRWGSRPEAKIASNTDVLLEGDAAGHLVADSGGRYAPVTIFAGEQDGVQLQTCFISADPGEDWGPGGMFTECNGALTTWSAAFTPVFTLADIEALPSCGDLAVAYLSDHCLTIETLPNGSDEVSFSAVVAYDID